MALRRATVIWESICEGCGYYETTIEFKPTLRAQADHAERNHQPERAAIYNHLVGLVEDDQYWVPAEWSAVAATVNDVSDVLMVQLQMQSNESRVIASANGKSVTYRPARPDDPANECS